MTYRHHYGIKEESYCLKNPPWFVYSLLLSSLFGLLLLKNLNCHTNIKKRKLNIQNLWPIDIDKITWQSLGNTLLTSSHMFCWNIGWQNFYWLSKDLWESPTSSTHIDMTLSWVQFFIFNSRLKFLSTFTSNF